MAKMETEFRSNNDCRPLTAAVTPELYRNNAFRITGLAVDATSRDITKHADKLKMMFELGHAPAGAGGIMPLQPPPTLHQVRAAVEMLREPETRLIHELFWFWPEEFGNCHTDAAFHAWAAGNGEAALRIWTLKEGQSQAGTAARHNLAVFWHMVAMDGEFNAIAPMDAMQSATLEEYWRMSVKRWAALVADDVFWERFIGRIRQIDDPRLTTGFARRVRMGLLEAMGRVHVELALRHTTNGNASLALVHAQLVREMIASPERMAVGMEKAMGSVKVQLHELARQTRTDCEKTPQKALALTARLVESAQPLLEILQFIHGSKESVECAEIFDEVAAVCLQCASTPQVAGDGRRLIELLEQARCLAVSPGLMQHIEGGLALWNGRERLHPVLEQLDKVRTSDIAPKSKVWRIRDHLLPQLGSMVAEDPYNPAVFETRSAIAGALREIAVAMADDGDDWDTAFEALDLAAQHACHEGLGRQIWADRSVIEGKKQARLEAQRIEARRQVVADVAEKLDRIEADIASPRVRAHRVEQEILPYISSKIGPDQRGDAYDCVAAALRRIALSAGEDYGDPVAAFNVITAAISLARDSDLRLQLMAEKVRAEERLKAREQQNLALKIRDDQIEINSVCVRINEQVFLRDEIIGVRFGSKTGDSRTLDRTGFQIELAATHSRRVLVDCHRLLRGKEQIREDYQKITQALQTHVAPQIAGAIARGIRSVGSYAFSENEPWVFAEELTGDARGTLGTTGLALSDSKISAGELRFEIKAGKLSIRRGAAETPVAQWSLGLVWNAVFFPEIVAAAQKQSYDTPDSYAG